MTRNGTLRGLPADIPLLVVLLVVVNVAIAFSPWQALRVSSGLILLFLLPGYAFVALLFPYRNEPKKPKRSGIDGLERAALSFGTSIALLPPLYLLAYVVVGRSAPSTMIVFAVLNGFIVITTLLGLIRRLRIVPVRRFSPSSRRFREQVAEHTTETDRRTMLANVGLAAAAFFSIGTLTYAITTPPDGERFSEFYLVSQRETGEYTAGSYQTTLTVGEPQSGIVGIENREHETVTYTVVAELQRVDVAGESVQVLERADRTEETVRIADGESAHVEPVITPTIVGENLRIQYGLYRGPAEGVPYRDLQLWVDVAETGQPPA